MELQYTMTAKENVNSPATRNEGGSHMPGIGQLPCISVLLSSNILFLGKFFMRRVT